MRFSSLGLLAGLAACVVAEDLLFIDSLQDKEYDEAIALGYTAKVVTETEWRAMTTADFAAFKAIVISDPECGDISQIKFLEDTKAVWSPAILGNMILIGIPPCKRRLLSRFTNNSKGTDPSYHFGTGGAQTLIDNSIKFVASGKTPGGVDQTGLYFALSCYYDSIDSSTVDALSAFGDFTVRGNLNCYNQAHLVAHSDAMTSLDDAAISDWSCSVHEAFSSYPSVGLNGFQALAIAQDIIGDGSQTFGDGTIGLPYIISRGATPAKCGDGVWDKSLGEECDDGNTVNGDGCSASCKCESGLPKGDGTCLPAPGGNITTPITTPISTPISSGSVSGYPTPHGGYYG
jgi:cysteine-rich repeat protein